MSLIDPVEGDLDFIRMTRDWSDEAKAEFAKTFNDLKEGRLRAWYCKTKQRQCDGKPHEGYEYPHARGDQWPPGDPHWFTWLLSGGRGSGKTRTGAEFARTMSKKVSRMALIAPTGADVRDTMIEGVSGLQYVCAMAGEKLKWEPSKRRVTFESGCIATTFSGEEPDRLRGPQQGFTWLDEPAHMPAIEDVWDMMLFGLRLGTKPRVVLTTTPLPTKWLKARIAEPKTRTVRVSTYANIDNLAETFRENVLSRYEGTRLGLQELHGMVLGDVEGALWNETIIHRDRDVDWRDMDRIVIGVDPAGTNGRKSDETGIVAVGIQGEVGFVLEDASGKYSPFGWARKVLELAWKYEASILAEKNYGGDMVHSNIKNAVKKKDGEILPRIIMATAMKSKALRAEPVVGLYEQTRVYHTGTTLAELEEEMMTWVPGRGDSPNRVDALVWALTELLKPGGETHVATPTGSRLMSGSGRGGQLRRRR